MALNAYTGLMGSGKSYEVVSEVIVPAIRGGRRVVTNVDGISEEKIHDYLAAKHPDDKAELYGRVLHVTNDQVFQPDFLPYYDDAKDAHTNTIVQPGDLVAIDEAWRFWGTDCKLHKHHKSFFLEHRHFVNDQTNVACDLVIMIQDLGTLHRFVKNVLAFTFRTHKKVSLGLNNTYSLNIYEGNKISKASQIGNYTRTYKKEIFPLYSSFKGGKQGVIVNADKRQNIFTDKKLWGLVLLLVGGGGVSAYNAWKFFHPTPKDTAAKASSAAPGASGKPAGTSGPAAAPRASAPSFSDAWRIAGGFNARGVAWVVLVNASGAVRLESPSNFANTGMAQIGDVDGSKVTAFSGGSGHGGLFSPSAAPAPAPGASESQRPAHSANDEVKK
jgi:zona occludens toxin